MSHLRHHPLVHFLVDRAKRHAPARAKRFYRRWFPRQAAPAPNGSIPKHRRYLSDKPERVSNWLEAAESYANVEHIRSYLYRKPYDSISGNTEFYHSLYPFMNLLKAMAVTHKGRILEVGCGPGWITEILCLLGFEVWALDPSETMLAVCRERVDAAFHLRKISSPPRLHLHHGALEDCDLPSDHFDGVLFFESLHHVIDERACFANVLRMLRPGGVVGVANDTNWIPGQKNLEATLEEEMDTYGTLENPFNREYLGYLLKEHGFEDAIFYHQINGFIPESKGGMSVAELAEGPSWALNTFTARKPSPLGPTTLDMKPRTAGKVRILASQIDGPEVSLTLRLENTGETTWLAENPPDPRGTVRIALRREAFNTGEAKRRCPLPRVLKPGQTVELLCSFVLPDTEGGWVIDLVVEGFAWLSQSGMEAPKVL